MKKYLLLILLASCFLLTYSRDFQYEYEGQTIVYTVIDESEKTCMTKCGVPWESSGNNVQGKVIIPRRVSDGEEIFEVEEIGEASFYGCGNILEVEIPKSIKKIGNNAFGFCKNLNNSSFAS